MISVLFVALLVDVLLPIAYFPLSPSVKECQQESLAKAKVSARQQCVYEDQFCHLTVV